MFNNQKVKVYLILFLVFSVASSKGIIIYNEETLVALSFLAFVIFCFNYFGNTVKDSLDERSSTIKFELENFHRLKEDALQELLSEHRRIEQLKKIFPSIGEFTQNQLSYTSTSGSQSIELHNRFSEQVQQKLAQLQSSKTLLQQRLQKSIALTIRPLVLAKIKQEKKGKKSNLRLSKVSSQVKQSLNLLKRS